MNKEYQNNMEPKVGDLVKLSSDTETVYKVISVLGGRLGNKVGVVKVNDPTYCREYYYYCLIKA
jgi:hypothetical protein